MLYSLLELKSLATIVKRKVLLIAYNMLLNTHVERVAMKSYSRKNGFSMQFGFMRRPDRKTLIRG